MVEEDAADDDDDDDDDDDGTPIFLFGERQIYVPPNLKKNTRMFLVVCWGEKTIAFMHNLVPLLEEQEECLEGF